jgi:TonB family protein
MIHNPRALERALALAAALALSPVAGLAQTPAPQFGHVPAKLLKRGSATAIPSGSGTVIVQVFVKKDGTFDVKRIISSTNHNFDAAALEIAKNSTYKPAMNGGAKVDEFYDFTLKFANGNANEPETASGLEAYERMVTGSPPNYAGARTGLESWLQSHPGDSTALTYLGVADFFLEDYSAASDAFDQLGDKLPPTYKVLAATAYTKAAIKESAAKNFDKSIALARRAVDLEPTFANYNALGLTQFAAADYPSAIISLEKARSLGQSANASAADRSSVDVNLVSAYLKAGNVDEAKKVAAEASQLNPSETGTPNLFANYYADQAQAAQKASNYGDAAKNYELGAAVAPPAVGAIMYAEAAIAYLQIKLDPNIPKDPNSPKAQADAEKALAIDPNSVLANYAEGIALANQGKKADALVHLNKASAGAKAESVSPQLSAAIDAALKQLNTVK